jgi:DNA ligase-1
MLKRGEEGTILKSIDGEWKDGKPNWQVKMKLEILVDLKITGFQWGSKGTKNEKVISTLFAESFCGLLKCKPTSMKEKMMQYVTQNQAKLIGTVVEVECSGLSHDSEGNYSLLHPRIIRLRDDKMTGDTLESIKKIEKAAKTLKKTKKEKV